MKDQLDRDNSHNEEYSQAVTRLIITLIGAGIVIYLILAGHYLPVIATLIAFSYLVFSLVWVFVVQQNLGRAYIRKYLVIFADAGIVSAMIFLADDLGGGLYILYLWMILGNGIRFGRPYLVTALLVSSISFILVLVYTPYWQDNLATGIGLLIGLAILPLFYAELMGRLHKSNDQLQIELNRSTYAATHDGLTALINRPFFVQRMDEEIKRAQRYGFQFCVFYIDLDNFKEANDTYGHLSGDKVIIEIADRLKKSIRVTDIAARMGGDEFSLILLSMSKRIDIENFSKKLAETLAEPVFFDDGAEYTPTASIGVSMYPDSGKTVNELVFSSDKAMYIAKRQGKNTFAISCKDDIRIEPTDKLNTKLGQS